LSSANGTKWKEFDVKARYWKGEKGSELIKASVITTNYVDVATEDSDED
jgi:hypothetical protein